MAKTADDGRGRRGRSKPIDGRSTASRRARRAQRAKQSSAAQRTAGRKARGETPAERRETPAPASRARRRRRPPHADGSPRRRAPSGDSREPVAAPEPRSSRCARAAPPAPPRPHAAGRLRPSAASADPLPDVEALARNIARASRRAARSLAAYLKPRESGEIKTTVGETTSARWSRRSAGSPNITWPIPQRAFAGANGAVQAIRRSLGLDPAAPPGRTGAAGRRARPRRQALRRSRVARQSLFRFHQAGLCADDALGRRSRQARRRSRSARRARRRSSTCSRSPRRCRPRTSSPPIRSFCARRSPRAARTWCAA